MISFLLVNPMFYTEDGVGHPARLVPRLESLSEALSSMTGLNLAARKDSLRYDPSRQR